ncbi:MAG: 30S ribosomal protein bS22 [Candidatus Entotheonellia bacterium]
MSSVVKKRRKKIRKHKFQKLRARTRIERRKRR